MTTNTIATIEGCPIERTIKDDGTEIVNYIAKAAVDNDGSGGNPEGDPDHQDETSLKNHGRSLNAEIEPYIVVPPAIIRGTKGVVLGCLVRCINMLTNKKAVGVVGDIGPHNKLGEVSVAMAVALGIPSSPNTGGTDAHIIQYTIYPGQVAPGYSLQPS